MNRRLCWLVLAGAGGEKPQLHASGMRLPLADIASGDVCTCQVPGDAPSIEALRGGLSPRPTAAALHQAGWGQLAAGVWKPNLSKEMREIAFSPSVLALLLNSLHLSFTLGYWLIPLLEDFRFPLKTEMRLHFLLLRCSARGRLDERASLRCDGRVGATGLGQPYPGLHTQGEIREKKKKICCLTCTAQT